jgi:predicted unusual protein kinase regulating ubiquinone biosynthesis (AarF/ABC1/UbiB family)
MTAAVGEIAVGTAVESAQRFVRGDRDTSLGGALLSGRNAELLARRLSTMRGAAMKLGQMLSIQSDDMLPREFRNALAILRSQASSMPLTQLKRVLGREYGKGWEKRFAEFEWEPVAAASIGQVHRARLRDGRELALKIQYPGVARSIDSDVRNMAALMRRLSLIPVVVDVDGIAAEARRQLHQEADYLAEAAHLEHYGKLLADSHEFVVPHVHRRLTTRHILAMDFVEGVSLETVADDSGTPQALRDRLGRMVYDLMFRELFEFRFMQTDPNSANYLYQPHSRRLALLDLGSASRYEAGFVEHYREVCRAVLVGDRAKMRRAAAAIGFVREDDPEDRTQGALDIIEMVCEPLRHECIYDFASSRLPARATDRGFTVVKGSGLRSPPPETIFLHRKLVGAYFICARLRSRFNVRALIEPHLR